MLLQYSVLKYCMDVYYLSFYSSARTTVPVEMPYDFKTYIYIYTHEFFNSLNVYVNILCEYSRRMNKKKIPNGFILYTNRIEKPIYVFISISEGKNQLGRSYKNG